MLGKRHRTNIELTLGQCIVLAWNADKVRTTVTRSADYGKLPVLLLRNTAVQPDVEYIYMVCKSLPVISIHSLHYSLRTHPNP